MLNITERFDSEIEQVNNIAALDLLRVSYLGKKGIVSVQLAQLGKIEVSLRKEQGAKINLLKKYVIEQIEKKRNYFTKKQIESQLAQEGLDVTLPRRANDFGSIHPISFATKEIVDIFANMGFSVVNGPEIEDDYHNFTALNIAKNHPARQMHDTFYLEQENKLLRTHTSSVQMRTLNKGKPPFAIIAPGKTYRCDSDNTHTPMFHQIEALYIGENVTMANLKYAIQNFIESFFGVKVKLRFRSSFFPFTEPSAEVDIAFKMTKDGVKIGDFGDFLEIMGCGMVHPNILEEANIDSKKYNGFALGLGIERVAMLKYGMSDLRKFFNADYSWSKNFNFPTYL
jgi:phenylalanyl-tRNA synthetase alpha chain